MLGNEAKVQEENKMSVDLALGLSISYAYHIHMLACSGHIPHSNP